MSEGAVDRRELAKVQPSKAAKWPRTERRRARIEAVLGRRQPDLTVVLENVHDPHNASAVVRSCDAVGVLELHLIYTDEVVPASLARTTSASAAKWVETRRHGSVEACYEHLRAAGLTVLAAALGEESVDLYRIDLGRPTALVFGNEMRGLSEEARSQADGLVTIPMLGMVESLNISVACAVSLYEAMRQRRDVGAYDRPKLAAASLERLTEEWLQR